MTTIPDPHPSSSAKEDFTIHSRWQETGAGRTDYQLTGGDVATAGIGAGHGVGVLGRRVRSRPTGIVSYDPDR